MFWSVRGGLGGGSRIMVLGFAIFSLEALTSVAGGVNMSRFGRSVSRLPTNSLLCAFEKEGYGRLAFESEAWVSFALL